MTPYTLNKLDLLHHKRKREGNRERARHDGIGRRIEWLRIVEEESQLLVGSECTVFMNGIIKEGIKFLKSKS